MRPLNGLAARYGSTAEMKGRIEKVGTSRNPAGRSASPPTLPKLSQERIGWYRIGRPERYRVSVTRRWILQIQRDSQSREC